MRTPSALPGLGERFGSLLMPLSLFPSVLFRFDGVRTAAERPAGSCGFFFLFLSFFLFVISALVSFFFAAAFVVVARSSIRADGASSGQGEMLVCFVSPWPGW